MRAGVVWQARRGALTASSAAAPAPAPAAAAAAAADAPCGPHLIALVVLGDLLALALRAHAPPARVLQEIALLQLCSGQGTRA
jgi:hypothetical protein